MPAWARARFLGWLFSSSSCRRAKEAEAGGRAGINTVGSRSHSARALLAGPRRQMLARHRRVSTPSRLTRLGAAELLRVSSAVGRFFLMAGFKFRRSSVRLAVELLRLFDEFLFLNRVRGGAVLAARRELRLGVRALLRAPARRDALRATRREAVRCRPTRGALQSAWKAWKEPAGRAGAAGSGADFCAGSAGVPPYFESDSPGRTNGTGARLERAARRRRPPESHARLRAPAPAPASAIVSEDLPGSAGCPVGARHCHGRRDDDGVHASASLPARRSRLPCLRSARKSDGFRCSGSRHASLASGAISTAGRRSRAGRSGAFLLLILFLALRAGPSAVAAVPHFARRLVGAAGRGLFQLVGLFLVFELQEVGYIEEGVALQTNVNKCRLHAGQDAGDAPVVNGALPGCIRFRVRSRFPRVDRLQELQAASHAACWRCKSLLPSYLSVRRRLPAGTCGKDGWRRAKPEEDGDVRKG